MTIQLSIVIPVYDEAESVVSLLTEIEAAGLARFEVLFVDDGSTDGTLDRLRLHRDQTDDAARAPVRLLRHHRRSGQSAAVRTGVRAAYGTWIATLDGDGQNDPADIAALLALAERSPERPALVGGIRVCRRDNWSKRLASRFANGVRQALLRDGACDTGCGIKLFRREVFLELPFFGAMHRFLPALFQAYGYPVVYAPVNHRPRLGGRSKYVNWRRGLIGLVDLLGVLWLKARTPPPPPVSEI